MREYQHAYAVEVSNAEEVAKLCETPQGQLILNELDLSCIHMHTLLINNVTQISDLVHAKGAFF